MQPNDLTASQYQQQLLKGSEEYIVNSGELGSRHDGAKPICNRQATSNDVTNFSSIDYIFYNLIGTHTITRILGNYGTAKGIAYFIEDKEHLYSKYPCILYREELDVEYYGNTNKVRAFNTNYLSK